MPESLLKYRRAGFAVLLLIAALALRWPTLGRQVWNLDEGSTITMAQLVLAGQVPYLEAADNRTPLVPYLKAAVLAVAGDWNARAVHVSVALMLGLTAVLLWQIARRLGHEAVGVWAAILFTWLSLGMLPAVDALTAHTGWFVIFFSSLGFWIFSAQVEKPSGWHAGLSGLAFGLAHLAKQPGLLDWGVCLVLVFLLAGFEPGGRIRLLRTGLPLLAGFLAPLALMVAYFQHRGALDDLIFYAWTYNTKYYVPEVPLLQRLAAVQVPFTLLLMRLPLILLLGLGAAVVLLRRAFGGLRRQAFAPTLLAWLILGWTASGLVSTMLSGRDFSHYSMQVLPGLSLACGWVLAQLHQQARTQRAAGHRGHWLAWLVATGLFFASLIIPTVRWIVASDTSDGITQEAGAVVRAHTKPEDRIFIWGYVPEMHVYAQRLPSTRFFYTNWVTGLIPWTNVDWMKDTAYAVIPGTPEILRQDFERRPPTVVVDSGSTRGYAKYPLKKQEWLWRTVQHEFAEVSPDIARPRGFRIYRRIADAPYGRPFPAEVTRSPAIKVSLPAQTRPETVTVRVDYPAGVNKVELYKDDELYRRIECPADQAGSVVFFVLGSDLPEGERRIQALTSGTRDLASVAQSLKVDSSLPLPPPSGPPLQFQGQNLRAIEATYLHGPMVPLGSSGDWNASAPSKLVYERPAGLHSVEFEFGISEQIYLEPAKWKTDGVEIVVQFAGQSGPPRTLYRRTLNPQVHGADRGLQTATVTMPLNEPGRIIFWVSPGALSDISSDMAYWHAIRGGGVPGGIYFSGQRLLATHLEIPLGMEVFSVDKNIPVLMTHAPSRQDFTLREGMHRVKGIIGLLSTAWTGPKKSAGAIFEIWHDPIVGEPRRLFQRRLDPGHNESERRPLPFSVDLPYPTEGRLRLLTLPAHPEDNSFNYTYWGELVAEPFQTVITTPTDVIRSSEAHAQFGFAETEESGKPVTLAHMPAVLVFPLRSSGRHLTGGIGLLRDAYQGSDATAGGRFTVEFEDTRGRSTVLWQKDLNPRDNPGDRGIIPFTVELPPDANGRLVLRTDARPGHGPSRGWTFWHDLRLSP